jgi:hypothetical protein
MVMGHDAIATIGPPHPTPTPTPKGLMVAMALIEGYSHLIVTLFLLLQVFLFTLTWRFDGFSYWVVIVSFHDDGWMDGWMDVVVH